MSEDSRHDVFVFTLLFCLIGESTRTPLSTLFDSPETCDRTHFTVLPKWRTDITMLFQDFLLLFQSHLVHKLSLQAVYPQCWGLFQKTCSAVKYESGWACKGYNQICHTIRFSILLLMCGEPASFVGRKLGACKNAAAAVWRITVTVHARKVIGRATKVFAAQMRLCRLDAATSRISFMTRNLRTCILSTRVCYRCTCQLQL